MKKYIALFSFALFACGGGGDAPEPKVEEKKPQAASLVYPENNSECEEGEVLSSEENRVTFIWNESPDTDMYELFVTNLDDNTTTSYTVPTNQKDVILNRGMPYSWYVVSEAEGTNNTATSVTWKFYNAGDAESNHPPFPAELIAPNQGATVDPGPVTLAWETTDLDGDEITDQLYFGEEHPPQTEIELSGNSSTTVTTQSGKIYYWQVISSDTEGHTTESQVFSFRTQ